MFCELAKLKCEKASGQAERLMSDELPSPSRLPGGTMAASKPRFWTPAESAGRCSLTAVGPGADAVQSSCLPFPQFAVYLSSVDRPNEPSADSFIQISFRLRLNGTDHECLCASGRGSGRRPPRGTAQGPGRSGLTRRELTLALTLAGARRMSSVCLLGKPCPAESRQWSPW